MGNNTLITHYCLGSALGPLPYPDIVRFFQSVISAEVKEQIHAVAGRDPDILIACIGGGSNAIGFFHHFIPNPKVQLIGVEGGGLGISSGKHAARFATGDLEYSTDFIRIFFKMTMDKYYKLTPFPLD